MARSHARWQLGALSADPELRARTPHEKLVYVFLVQDTYLNPAGVLISCEESWAEDLGLTETEMDKAMRGLEQHRFVVSDSRTHEVLVRSYIRNDGVAEQPNVLKQALVHARRIKSAELRRVLAGELRRLPQAPPPRELANGRLMVYPDPHACADEIEVPGTPPPPPSSKASGKASGNPSEKGVQGAFPEPQGEGVGEGEGVPSRSSQVGEAKTAPRSRGTRLPEDWTVTPELVTWCKQACPDVDGRFETERFKNHFLAAAGQKGVKVDWVKTWKNWMLTEQKRAMERRPAGSHLRAVPSYQRELPTDTEAAFTDLRDRADANAAAKLIGDYWSDPPRRPSEALSHDEFTRRARLAFIDENAVRIRDALARRQAG